jgi:hypothetical protein
MRSVSLTTGTDFILSGQDMFLLIAIVITQRNRNRLSAHVSTLQGSKWGVCAGGRTGARLPQWARHAAVISGSLLSAQKPMHVIPSSNRSSNVGLRSKANIGIFILVSTDLSQNELDTLRAIHKPGAFLILTITNSNHIELVIINCI